MARIRSAGNKSTEEMTIKAFRAEGITGWRRNCNLPGKPDFIFRGNKVAVLLTVAFGIIARNTALSPSQERATGSPKLKAIKNVIKK